MPNEVTDSVIHVETRDSLWISVALVLAVGLACHVAGDLVEEPGGALLLQYAVASHELVDGRHTGRRQVQQNQSLKEMKNLVVGLFFETLVACTRRSEL